MTELMKDKYYNHDTLYDLASRIKNVYPPFPIENFVSDIMDENWETLELKARMRQITVNLGKYLPNNYGEALGILDQVVAGFPAGHNDNALIYFPDFVEVYGRAEKDWDLTIAALERYTKISTAEFAVRPLIIKNEARMMGQMAVWARHENEHVRRLASEGCRPALPWGQALTSFKKDPAPVIAILEQLKTDPSLYVRKSVANNLNDISKTHPDLVAEIAKDWYGKDKHTDWIVKHGCRTLLKKGNREVLGIFGYYDASSVDIQDFTLESNTIPIGENLTFSFTISAKESTKLRLEYGVDYIKANGKRSRKIFQLSDTVLKADQSKTYTKNHAFADLSSRKHYPGVLSVTLIVNGTERGTLEFDLTK
ncbi:DNA alkylation repair protein [Enterococcus sp. 669A]|uniref:DNA alkylation repair protein n=1 Tax=Candidatus Enterococcus moelleringii TaxID=2815325 RepID=A0ABS3LID4_9ENTE|nr:DNA alkylation repair protein [Enterococcus sp. 669A]MBO1308865.1 DNA alkylation repair protein [Enterococcus sp. 669A]